MFRRYKRILFQSFRPAILSTSALIVLAVVGIGVAGLCLLQTNVVRAELILLPGRISDKSASVLKREAIVMGMTEVMASSSYYVDTGGDDANPGTAASPFRTIQKAASVVGAGDTVLVKPGIYAERLNNVIPSGTSWSAAVTIKAYDPNNRPVIEAPSGSTGVEGLLKIAARQYIVLDGVILDAKRLITTNVYLASNSHHIRIMNSEIRNGVHSGIFDESLDGGGGHNEYLNLEVHHNGDASSSLGLSRILCSEFR